MAELTGEAGLLRKQLDDAEHELERLAIAGQVITQLTADDAPAGEAASAGPAQRGSGLLVPPRSQASGPGDLPDDYRLLAEAVAAAAAETGGPVTCAMAAQRVGLDVAGARPRTSAPGSSGPKTAAGCAATQPAGSPSRPDLPSRGLPLPGHPRRACRRV